MESLQEKLSNKLFVTTDELKLLCNNWKTAEQTIVFTNGCFDLLHRGHLTYLNQARTLGDKLIIGVNSDKSVKLLKGPTRPLNNETDRKIHLACLSFVDAVISFEEETPSALISELEPDILVKGGDYTSDQVAGKKIVESTGGKVVILPFLEGYSTSKFIQKIHSL